jgi:hypothetical protein
MYRLLASFRLRTIVRLEEKGKPAGCGADAGRV